MRISYEIDKIRWLVKNIFHIIV